MLQGVLMYEPPPQLEIHGAHTASEVDVAGATWNCGDRHVEIVWQTVSDVAVHCALTYCPALHCEHGAHTASREALHARNSYLFR